LKLISQRPPPSGKKFNRAQSAKSRIEGNWKLDNRYSESKTGEISSRVRKTQGQGSKNDYEEQNYQIVPFGGKPVPVVDIGGNAPYPSYNFQEKKNSKYEHRYDKPFSFKIEGNLIDFRENITVPEKDSLPNEREKIRPSSAKCSRVKTDNITPVVYNLTTNQKIFGEELHSVSHSKQGTSYKLDGTDGSSNSSYKEGKKNR
jgi:hypothetical protein